MSLPCWGSLLLLFSLVLFSGLAVAEGGGQQDDESVCKGDNLVEEGCPLQGNGDFYGLGVRVGIYFQWVTSWLANNFLAEEIIGSLETNSIFLLALFATVLKYSLQTAHIRVVDVLIIHQLCMGFLFSIMSLWGYRTMYYMTEGPGGRRHFGGFGTHLRLALMTAISGYGVWFWVHGIDTMPSCDRRDACGGLDTCFIVPMKVKSHATRALNLVIAIGLALYYGTMAITAVVAGVFSMADSDCTLDKRELTIWYIILSVFNVLWQIAAIVNIEVTINLNHMSNVIGMAGIAGAGQLIPALIGVISFGKVLYELGKQNIPWMRRKKGYSSNSLDSDGCKIISPTGNNKSSGGRPGLGLGLSQGAYASAPQHETLEPDADAEHQSTTPAAAQKKRTLPHRILLAWLPWLNVFEWSRRSFTPRFVHGKTKDPRGAGFEVLGVKRTGHVGGGSHSERERQNHDARQRMGHTRNQSSTSTTTTLAADESPSTALLSSPAQCHSLLRPGTHGLMAEITDQLDIELSERRSPGSSTPQARRSSDTIVAGRGGGDMGMDTGMYEGKGYQYDD